MLDFLIISTRPSSRGTIQIYPRFRMYPKSSDLMIRGGDFYAVWDEERGLWSTDEQDVLRLIDAELDKYVKENRDKIDGHIQVLYMWDSESGMVDSWHKYCQKQARDSFTQLDDGLLFANSPTDKKDYASKRLPYALEKGDITAYDKIISTLYEPEERHKIEWAIGAIVSGDSKTIQKFLVLYGSAGTGKSTILNIIQQLFEGYYCAFDAKALGSSGNQFALEDFKNNPLVAIQHDGDLSRIEDNTRINSIVSHELMPVNEKYSKKYFARFNCFLFMGTNKPVKITDAKSGIIRRLIDVTPSGKKLSVSEYKTLTKQVKFELGAIAQHCLDVYLEDPDYYDTYKPISMMGATNDFYNFILESYDVFKKEDGTTLKAAWAMYNNYCEEAKVPYPYPRRNFAEELRNYFVDYFDRFTLPDGSRVRSYFSGFKTDILEQTSPDVVDKHKPYTITFDIRESIFDKECANWPAQYASPAGTPLKAWGSVTTTLADINTSELHYVGVPEEHKNHIIIDFDIPDENGNKCFEKNLEAASKWPATYAELSKSGAGIHLHYIYNGDVTKLARVFDEHIEVKVFKGDSSIRRKLTRCNNLPIATLSSGLPLKGDDKVVDFNSIKNEKSIRTLIKNNLNKEYHAGTKPSIDFIYKILEDAYSSGMCYDVSDMFNDVLAFAANSTNQSDYCIKLVTQMHFKSENPSENTEIDEGEIIFYDVEVFSNLFIVCWKVRGSGKQVVKMINPTPSEIEVLMRHKLVGFNCRKYDNHILYGRLMGYNNAQLYKLSQMIIQEKQGFFGEAYNVSYTDIYDFSSNKQSLKKWEIDLGIHHQELGLPWDKPVPEHLWSKVAEYCVNDVIATEAVFEHLKGDWLARQILADIAGMTVNDTTNSLTTKFIFGNDRNPQRQFNYRNMGKVEQGTGRQFVITEDLVLYDRYGDEYTLFDEKGRPVFPGYEFKAGTSTYRGIVVGEGGRVYAEPGIYTNVALLDVASMHPSSVVAEELFGPVYTARFKEILDARIAIKHKDFDTAKKMLNGALAKYLDDEEKAAVLAQALKIAINSVYGLTAAAFDNPFRDPRNIDNIVAKRGALFMINLQFEVQKRGFTVVHIKTDSIKVADATPEIIDFIMSYGKQYGYTFEHEATYEKMCIVNDAVYIAKYKDGKHAGEWTATGKQFQVPYTYKKLFSKESITFEDMCETNAVQTALYLDMNENLPDVAIFEKEYAERTRTLKDNGKDKRRLNPKLMDISDDELLKLIDDGHNRVFVGKIGQFCPMKPGSNGGILLREGKDKNGNVKYDAAVGSKGYRWLESEMVKKLALEDSIDRSYYDTMVDKAVEVISQYGDFEWFIAD